MNNMTEETLNKAKRIKQDLKALDDMTINLGASQELVNSWKKWANTEMERLRKEFEDL